MFKFNQVGKKFSVRKGCVAFPPYGEIAGTQWGKVNGG